MIRYRLGCRCGHEFETWFQNSRSFDTLAMQHALSCPACGGTDVGKAVMAPSVSTRARAEPPAPAAPVPDAAPTPMATASDDLIATFRRLRQEVKEKAEYVGPRFAAEARRIDAGDAPDRGIYGEATAGEARALIEDGIAVLPLPRLPEDSN